MTTPNTRSFQMGLILTNARKNILKDPHTDKIFYELLNNINLTTKYVKSTLREKRPTKRETIEIINNKMYDETMPYDNIAKHCKNYFQRLDLDYNTDKVDKEKMNNFIKNCEKLEIRDLCQKEKVFHLILDNYSVHHSAYIEHIGKILNLNLIFLPTYSPDLNPIEDVWRIIKKFVSNKFIKTGKDIVNLYISKFYEEVKSTSLYENWLKEFMNICIKS